MSSTIAISRLYDEISEIHHDIINKISALECHIIELELEYLNHFNELHSQLDKTTKELNDLKIKMSEYEEYNLCIKQIMFVFGTICFIILC